MAVLCLTENGLRLATVLAENMQNTQKIQASQYQSISLYIPKRLHTKLEDLIEDRLEVLRPTVTVSFYDEWQNVFSEAFHQYSHVICIMATGIVVRSLAPLVRSKYTDPGIVVLDEAGKFAISLLSGHVGGANQLAEDVASAIGAMPVITTATDVNHKPAIDIIAKRLSAVIEPISQVKTFNRLLVENQTVSITSPFPLTNNITEGFVYNDQDKDATNNPTVIVSPFVHKQQHNSIQIIPKTLIIGIGCRKGALYTQLQAAVESALEQYDIHRNSLKALATIDFKAAEPGIKELAAKMELPIIEVPKDEISRLEENYIPSEWVRKSIGVGGVCEPAAKIAAKYGITIIPKQIINSVTISIAMEKSWWWDWDLVTEATVRQQP
ncbi:hypothetical protein BHF68_13085 [Desulfuribacillus alkaliarsenatis]|uniref:Cobalamin biosynthesis protein CbiG n=1 Tax=Desulfuribacillus alkaliarsenatis TaxID=766136 RepID=A0A1E5G4K5_9FIRM|nr:hypothetical protein BHF68_13085 [Desulfuribacillus alkaliarsenatis]